MEGKEVSKHRGWIASLNNGQEVFEQPDQPGEITAWQKLLKWLSENPQVKITQMRLQRGGITITAIPKATGYMQGYRATKSMHGTTPDTLKQGIGTVIKDWVYITWVNEQGDVWQDVEPLANNIMHTTLRYQTMSE